MIHAALLLAARSLRAQVFPEPLCWLCAKVSLFGCVRVRSMVKDRQTVKVRVGTFTSESPLKPIQAR